MHHEIRPAAVAGMFYPGDRAALKSMIEQLRWSSDQIELPEIGRLKALVVPHAGYVYSGPVAASAYRLLAEQQLQKPWLNIVILGPNHRVPLKGMALSSHQYWSTPMGEISINTELNDWISEHFQVPQRPDVHQLEHSLEVQVPFIQQVASSVSILPIVVGPTPAEQVADLIQALWQRPDLLVLISSDLSHYHPYREAQLIDQETTEMIEARDFHLLPEQACGCYSLNGLLLAAKRESLTMTRLCQCTSGDTAGDKAKVVGYGAYACY